MPVPTKESVTEKLNGLKQQKDQLVANTNAVAGAIHVLEQLVLEFDGAEIPAEDVKDRGNCP